MQQSSFDASAAIQTYVGAILKQADMKLDEMPGLPQHQATARNNAKEWTLNIQPGMITTNADIIDFANQFNSYYENLIAIADQVATDPDAQKEFIEGLTALRNSISRKQSKVKQIESDLKGFQDTLNGDHATFQADADEATKLYVGENAELQKLADQIAATQRELNKQIGVMAGGAAGILAGLVAICVGALAEIPSAGLSNSVIAAGLGLILGGISTEIAGGVEYGLAVKQMGELQAKLAEDKQGLVAVKVIVGQLNGIVDELQDAVDSAGKLLQQWTDLYTSFDKLMGDVDSDPGQYGPLLKAMLNKAKEDWNEALSLATKMQPTGDISVTQYDNIQDAIHTDG